MNKPTHYQVLGISEDAGPSVIKLAWRKIAMASHPDRNPGNARAEKRFKRASAAWDVLGNVHRRHAYNAQLARRRVVSCTVCGNPSDTGGVLCSFCALRADLLDRPQASGFRVPPPVAPRRPPNAYERHQAKLEELYGWTANPSNFDHLMGHDASYYDTLGSLGTDDLLSALLAEAAIKDGVRMTRSAFRARRGSVEVQLGEDVVVRIDHNTLDALRKIQRSLKRAQGLMSGMRDWWSW